MEEIVESGSYGVVAEPFDADSASFETGRERPRLGKFVFMAMLLGGLGVLWIYGALSRSINPVVLSRIQNFISTTIFNDSAKVVILISFAIVVGLVARRARKRANFQSLALS